MPEGSHESFFTEHLLHLALCTGLTNVTKETKIILNGIMLMKVVVVVIEVIVVFAVVVVIPAAYSRCLLPLPSLLALSHPIMADFLHVSHR